MGLEQVFEIRWCVGFHLFDLSDNDRLATLVVTAFEPADHIMPLTGNHEIGVRKSIYLIAFHIDFHDILRFSSKRIIGGGEGAGPLST